MAGVIAKKLGMTRVVNDKGDFVPATVLSVVQNKVLQVKTKEKDNVDAIILGVAGKKEGTFSQKKQFRVDEGHEYAKDQEVGVTLFDGVEAVRVTGTSKGKGFQGVVKRYGFGGGRATHGGKYRKAPGSIGTRKPTKVMKGRKLPGHMGDQTITIKNIPVLDVDAKNSLLVVKGAIPGATGSVVYVTL